MARVVEETACLGEVLGADQPPGRPSESRQPKSKSLDTGLSSFSSFSFFSVSNGDGLHPTNDGLQACLGGFGSEFRVLDLAETGRENGGAFMCLIRINKLLVTSASLLVTSALLVVTRSY